MFLKEIKNWNVNIEKKIIEELKSSNIFSFNEKTRKKVYSIDTPPPYVNSPIHMGHAVTYVYQDFFARYRRMKGFEVLFPLGLDRNGLPIEIGAEKKFNISPFKLSREEFLGYCKKLLEETSLSSTESFLRLGISFNSYQKNDKIGCVYFTDDEKYRILTQTTFINLFKKGFIYEDFRVNNWDSGLQTTIADSEIEYRDIETFFNYIKFKVKETGEEIVIATTRPELICTCGMVIFNPEDKRYRHLEGKKAITPVFGKEVVIKSHSSACIEKGTGLVMMCSMGDLADIQFFREMQIKPVIAINQDGRMNESSGFLSGLKVREAREKMINKLKSMNLLVKQDKIIHRTPVSERSGVEIEFIEMPEYYLRQLDIKGKIKKLSKKINFFPESSRKILEDWIDSVLIDWPVSRRRFYATEIPLWSCRDKKGKICYAVPTKIKYHQPWKQEVDLDAEVYCEGKKIGLVRDFKNCEWRGDERVFDTWFDSSISVLYILNYSKNKKFFIKNYPVSLRPQGKEIVRTWLYYTLLRGYYETNKIAFKEVWIHNHVLDKNGFKMSKSLGNVISPNEILDEFGAEALRLWASEEGDISKGDLICSKERIKSGLKTINKLINISKFVMQFEKPLKKPKLTPLDKLFINYTENLISECDEFYWNYNFYTSSLKLRNFLWNIFASNYIELVKARVYNTENLFSLGEANSAKYTLHYILEKLIVLYYPIIPRVTGIIAREKNINLTNLCFPKARKNNHCDLIVSSIMNFNSFVWKVKKEKQISLKGKISGIQIPEELKEFKSDFLAAHNLV